MQKSEIKQRAADMVREAVREKEISSNAGVLGHIPSVLDSVSIDTETIMRCVDNELNRKTANPLNALLSLFGLRIVHTKNAINDLSMELGGVSDTVTLEIADSDKLTAFLKIDARLLKEAIDKMADELKQTEDEQQSMQRSLREQAATLHKETDKASSQLSQANTDLEYQQNTVAQRAQYMLSLAGESPADPLMHEQITELLADLELSAHWTTEGTGLKEAAMFSVLKCEEPEKRKNKPCIMKDAQIVLKGVRFVADTVKDDANPTA